MLRNNAQRLGILLSMENKADYNKFITLCETEEAGSMSITEFAYRSGLLMVAMLQYPDLEPLQAYLMIVKEGKEVEDSNRGLPAVRTTGCCGGGNAI